MKISRIVKEKIHMILHRYHLGPNQSEPIAKKIEEKTHNKEKTPDVCDRIELRRIIFISLEEIGVFFSEQEKDAGDDINLNVYLFDSLQLIRFVVALEQNLSFELTDELLKKENFETINTLVEQIKNFHLQG